MARTVRELPVKAINALGAKNAVPGADGFVECSRYTVPAGKVAIVDLQQWLGTNPAIAANFEAVGGIVWRLRRTDLSGSNPQDVSLSFQGTTLFLTRFDGRPAVRAMRFTEGTTLSWGADVTVADVVNVSFIAGAIEGWEIDAALEAELALQLLRR